MTNIARLHASDIATGNIVQADPLNNELNQLVVAVNDKDDRVAAIESGNVTIAGNKTFSGTTTLAACIPTLTGTPNGEAELGWNSTTKSIQVHNGTAVGIVETTLNQGLIIVQDQKSSGTDGGTFTSGARRTRVLNTEVLDTGNHCTLASNQITLAAGTYRGWIYVPAYQVNSHKAWFRNVTDSADVIETNHLQCGATTEVMTMVVGFGRFTIAASKVFEVQGLCFTTKATTGFGINSSLGTEIYTTVILEKEAA